MESKGESQFSVLLLPLSFARSRESKGCPDSHFDQGVGLRGRGRYPLKPRIFSSLLETKGYPEHTAARSSKEYVKSSFPKRYKSILIVFMKITFLPRPIHFVNIQFILLKWSVGSV